LQIAETLSATSFNNSSPSITQGPAIRKNFFHRTIDSQRGLSKWLHAANVLAV
jgi:hypothetical protein